METFRFWSVVQLIIACGCYSQAKEMTDIEVLSALPTRCTYEYAYDMYGAHCAGLRMTKIPTLRSGVEILDFTDNKLRELTSETFYSYTGIKFLYLADNQIYLMDENTFSSMTYLQTLDLSRNVLTDVPNSVFSLPSLRKLYLGGNPLIHLSTNSLTIPKPIKAPLEHLDISDCKIRQLPFWGALPQLIFYNISHNPLIDINSTHFASLCNLRKVDLSEAIDRIKVCDIKPTIWWFQLQQVFFQLDDYSTLNSKEFDDCQIDDTSSVLNVTHYKCKREYFQVHNVRGSRRTWLTIGGGLAGFMVGFILLLYIMHRYNVAKTKQDTNKAKKLPVHDGDKHATAVLLNNAS